VRHGRDFYASSRLFLESAFAGDSGMIASSGNATAAKIIIIIMTRMTIIRKGDWLGAVGR
jgi:hypothetical protein